jgi:hypothetical protein
MCCVLAVLCHPENKEEGWHFSINQSYKAQVIMKKGASPGLLETNLEYT